MTRSKGATAPAVALAASGVGGFVAAPILAMSLLWLGDPFNMGAVASVGAILCLLGAASVACVLLRRGHWRSFGVGLLGGTLAWAAVIVFVLLSFNAPTF